MCHYTAELRCTTVFRDGGALFEFVEADLQVGQGSAKGGFYVE